MASPSLTVPLLLPEVPGTEKMSDRLRTRRSWQRWFVENLPCPSCTRTGLVVTRPRTRRDELACSHCSERFRVGVRSAPLKLGPFEFIRSEIADGTMPHFIAVEEEAWRLAQVQTSLAPRRMVKSVNLFPRGIFSTQGIKRTGAHGTGEVNGVATLVGARPWDCPIALVTASDWARYSPEPPSSECKPHEIAQALGFYRRFLKVPESDRPQLFEVMNVANSCAGHWDGEFTWHTLLAESAYREPRAILANERPFRRALRVLVKHKVIEDCGGGLLKILVGRSRRRFRR